MPRLENEERKMKLKALRVALIILEKNDEKVNFMSVLRKANEIGFPKYFRTPIAEGSVKVPQTLDFINLVEKIKKVKARIKKLKNALNKKTAIKIYNLKEKVANSTYIIAELLEQNRTQEILLTEKEKSLQYLRNERNALYQRLNGGVKDAD